MSQNIALVLLSGSSTRFEGPVNKLFIKVKNIPLFIYPLLVLQNSNNIDEIILVTKKEFEENIKSFVKQFNINKISKIVYGGETRSQSVYNGLSSINNDNSIVLICDGDRPNLTDQIINANIEACKSHDGCVTAVKSIDSTFSFNQKISYLDRSTLFNAQTPQSFKISVIKSAYQKTNFNNFTDDASIALNLEYDIVVVNGNYENYKITTKSDLIRFETEKNK